MSGPSTISDLQDDDDDYGDIPAGVASTGGAVQQYGAPPAGGAADSYGFGGYEPPPPVSYGYDGPGVGQSEQNGFGAPAAPPGGAADAYGYGAPLAQYTPLDLPAAAGQVTQWEQFGESPAPVPANDLANNFGAMGLGVPLPASSSYTPPAPQPTLSSPEPYKPMAPAASVSPASRFGGGDKCPRCHKTVYMAEAREGPNNVKYHRACFACLVCSKTLDASFNERQGDLFCKSCYATKFGPVGFGFSGHSASAAGSSLNTPSPSPPVPSSQSNYTPPKPYRSPDAPSANRTPPSAGGSTASNKPAPRFGGGDKCPRCDKTVYAAEAREGPNNLKFHKTCFACATCKKTLDSHFNERQGEVFCKPCYSKDFGPKGFGFGASMSPE